MNIITARIPKDLNVSLTAIAKKTDRSKSYIVVKAIKKYILELQEDIEDYNDAIEILAENNPRVSWEKVQRDCGLLEN